MSDCAQSYLHMDEHWMWRFFFLDKFGDLIATSAQAYFSRAEAEAAMRQFRRHGMNA